MRVYVCLFAALVAVSAIASDYSAYYTPTGWRGGSAGIASVSYTAKDGSVSGSAYSIESDGSLSDEFYSFIDSYARNEVALTALNALEESLEAQIMVDTMARTVDSIVNGGLYTSYTDADGESHAAKVMFDPAEVEGGTKVLKGESLTTGKVVGDGVTIEKSAAGKMSIKGWSSDNGEEWTLSSWLGGNVTGNSSLGDIWLMARHEKALSPSYIKIGPALGAASTVVDGESVVTNEASGGALSVKGFVAAQEGASEASPKIPFTDGGSVEWGSLGSFFSDSLFAVGTDGKVKLTGYTSTVGQKMYFGTDASSDIGFHTLPTGYSPDGLTLEEKNAETHTIGVKWPSGDGIFGGTASGWMAIPAAQGGNGGAIPPDGTSLALVSSGTVTNIQVAGWTSQAHCSENLHDLLDGNSTDSAEHQVLCRIGTGSDAQLHYLELGSGKFYEPDGDTITVEDVATSDGTKKRLVAHVGLQNVDTAALATNAVSGSSADGILSIRGLHLSASSGKFLKNESGIVTWTDVPQGGVNVKSASGSYVSGTNIVFDTKSDSNVQFEVTGSGETVTVKIGVYYQ